MIFDLLKAYKGFLLEEYRPSTAEKFHAKIATLLKGQSISDTAQKLDIDKILEKLSQIKHKNYFSQSKNAFLHFCKFQNIELSAHQLEAIKDLELKTHKKRRQLKTIDYKEIEKKIKRIKNQRLKLSYQVMLVTGLRVSELADISLGNCTVEKNEITLNFTAKGGGKDVVAISITEYPNLYQELKGLIENQLLENQEKKLFYSVNYLQRKAKPLGFGCHDLRRTFAKLEYKKSSSKPYVMEKLRHKSLKATNIYLRSKIKM